MNLIGALAAIAGVTHHAAADPIPLSPIAQASGATLSTSYGIEFVTVGSAGNAAYSGDPTLGSNNLAANRGAVNYDYRIGRYEVSTSQWAQFFNAWAYVSATQGSIPFVQTPGFWGAMSSTNPYGAGQGWSVPAGNEMRPVGNVSWRTAAIYCNWLCNGQAITRGAFLNGAYDVSTFGYFGNIFTDQLTHNPNAQYWIPTWDEWLKAAHYDPNRNGPGQGGWWLEPNAGDTALTYLAPSQGGQANSGWRDATNSQWQTPLGSYSAVQSPWGLLDVAGGTTEWMESVQTSTTGARFRMLDGSSWGSSLSDSLVLDNLNFRGAEFPSFSPLDFGFRIAAAVPTPGTCCVLIPLLCVVSVRHRRYQ